MSERIDNNGMSEDDKLGSSLTSSASREEALNKEVNQYQELMEKITDGNIVEVSIDATDYRSKTIKGPMLYGVDSRGHLYYIPADGETATVMEINSRLAHERNERAQAMQNSDPILVGPRGEVPTEEEVDVTVAKFRDSMVEFGNTLSSRRAPILKDLEQELHNFLYKQFKDEDGNPQYRGDIDYGAFYVTFRSGITQESKPEGGIVASRPLQELQEYLEARVPSPSSQQ